MLLIFYCVLKATPYNLFDYEIKIVHNVTKQYGE
jgi:hypothetical protein